MRSKFGFRNRRRLSAALWLSLLWAGTATAESLPVGTIEADVSLGTIVFGELVEPLEPLGNNSNRCRIDQDTGAPDLLQFSASPSGDPSISLQRLSIGIDSTNGQGCGFAVDGETLGMSLGDDVPSGQVSNFSFDIIVTDDAVFELLAYDAEGNFLPAAPGLTYSYKVFTGKSACDPFGTSGDPLDPGFNGIVQFACSAQSNPNSDFQFSLAESDFDSDVGDWERIEFKVTAGDVGIRSATLELGLVATGTLTCEEDSMSIGAVTITDPLDGIFDAGGGVQCRRLPNRDGSQCLAVPYIIETDCLDGGTCSVDFIHGDQPGVAREDFAFLCEVWWPEEPGDFTAGKPLLQETEISWGGLTTPLTQGDVPVSYCAGITPILDALVEPNPSTDCGTGLLYQLSVPTNGIDPIIDGGTVTTNVSPAECSLLETYDDVLVPATFPDQCTSADCPIGRQIACLIDSRTSQVQDPDAICDGGPCPGLSPGDVDSATSLFRDYELIFIQGDLRMARF